MSITEEERARLDALTYEPDIHLTASLRRFGADIIEGACFARGMHAALGALTPLALRDVREAVLEAAACVAAYDMAVAAGLARISNAEWRELRKAALGGLNVSR